jgi:hypothetical protein
MVQIDVNNESGDNMDRFYSKNSEHHDTGLMRIGLSEKQTI